MYVKPKYLYKYKGMVNDTDVQRICDVIANHRIYLPKYDQLNDPVEASAVGMDYSSAGAGYTRDMGIRSYVEEEVLRRIGIMSLSSKWDSYLMWAHYATNYSGCVFVFSTENTFSKVTPVIYSDDRFIFNPNELIDQGKYDKVLLDSLLFKLRDWSYENEWRLLKKNKNKYLRLRYDDLSAIILGNKIKDTHEKEIIRNCKAHGVECFKIYRDDRERRIIAYPVDDYIDYGMTIKESLHSILMREEFHSGESIFSYLNDFNLIVYK